ncbi:hypothetical protein, partial [Alistipes sp.]|uniref:hypothetical protein n=1 Tax=Alistipes sp. TaxID=1872444 RepID=UPI003AF51CA4
CFSFASANIYQIIYSANSFGKNIFAFCYYDRGRGVSGILVSVEAVFRSSEIKKSGTFLILRKRSG